MNYKMWMFVGLVVWLASTSGLTAWAQGSEGERCANLVGSRFDKLPDAPTHIVTAKVLTPADGLPEVCDVRGYVASQVQFFVRMPTQNWNGKLLLSGCGGFCGSVYVASDRINDALKRGYAVTDSDMGHTSTALDGKWAYNNRQAEIDFAYRATHVNAVAAKAIVAAFYGRPQRYSYFYGCSTGGRQGLMEAQRFPEDFDGIIAGAPSTYYATSNFQLLWSALVNLDADNKPILKAPQVQLLHKAVREACDALDGLKDGIIEDPRNCKFDPGVLRCKGGDSDCLTDKQVEVVRKIYQGPVNSKGEKIHVGTAMLGSELNWIGPYSGGPIGPYIGDENTPGRYLTWMIDKLRYMTFFEDPGPSWELKDLDWDTDPARAGGLGSLYSATNPDLRKFKASGGKMIGYHGWQDQSVTPMQYVDYYELTTSTMGGLAATQDFFRLFMLPGVNHCATGPGADTIDYVSYLEEWVEKGKAPDVMIGKHIEGGVVKFTRPHFPYPGVARYSGRGDVNDAANWRRVTPGK